MYMYMLTLRYVKQTARIDIQVYRKIVPVGQEGWLALARHLLHYTGIFHLHCMYMYMCAQVSLFLLALSFKHSLHCQQFISIQLTRVGL